MTALLCHIMCCKGCIHPLFVVGTWELICYRMQCIVFVNCSHFWSPCIFLQLCTSKQDLFRLILSKFKKQMNDQSMDTEDDWKKRTSFLSGLVVAFKEKTHTDIQLKPNNGPCIPAHKVVLVRNTLCLHYMYMMFCLSVNIDISHRFTIN